MCRVNFDFATCCRMRTSPSWSTRPLAKGALWILCWRWRTWCVHARATTKVWSTSWSKWRICAWTELLSRLRCSICTFLAKALPKGTLDGNMMAINDVTVPPRKQQVHLTKRQVSKDGECLAVEAGQQTKAVGSVGSTPSTWRCCQDQVGQDWNCHCLPSPHGHWHVSWIHVADSVTVDCWCWQLMLNDITCFWRRDCHCCGSGHWQGWRVGHWQGYFQSHLLWLRLVSHWRWYGYFMSLTSIEHDGVVIDGSC